MVDWVERLFHVSPDAGNGSFEILIVLVVTFAVTAALSVRMHRSRRRTHHRCP
jgi:cell division protein FtsX